MTDELEDVPLTDQDVSDLMEAGAIATHTTLTTLGSGEADRYAQAITTLLATANRIAAEHGYVDGTAGVTNDASGLTLRRARRAP